MQRSSVIWQTLTSSMTEQMCLTHWVMACGVPEIVTALSVDSGNMSPATWTWAPVVLKLRFSGKKQKKNKGFLAPRIQHYHPDWNAVSSSPKLPQTHFDMQRATPSQIEMRAPTFWEVQKILSIQSTYALSAGLSRHNHWDFALGTAAEKTKKHVLRKKINKRSLTGVFDTRSVRTPKKRFTPQVLKKNNFLI